MFLFCSTRRSSKKSRWSTRSAVTKTILRCILCLSLKVSLSPRCALKYPFMSVMIRVNNILYSLSGENVSAMSSASFAPFLQYVNVPTVSGEIAAIDTVAMYSSGSIVRLGGQSVVHTKIKSKSEDAFKEVYMTLEDYYDAPTSVLRALWNDFSKKSVIVSSMMEKMTMPSRMVSKASKLTQKGMLLLQTMPQFVAQGGAWGIQQPTPSYIALALKAAEKDREEKAVIAAVKAVEDVGEQEEGSEAEQDGQESEEEAFEEGSESEEEREPKKRKVDVMADIDRDIKRGESYLKRAESKIAAYIASKA